MKLPKKCWLFFQFTKVLTMDTSSSVTSANLEEVVNARPKLKEILSLEKNVRFAPSSKISLVMILTISFDCDNIRPYTKINKPRIVLWQSENFISIQIGSSIIMYSIVLTFFHLWMKRLRVMICTPQYWMKSLDNDGEGSRMKLAHSNERSNLDNAIEVKPHNTLDQVKRFFVQH